MIEVKGSTPGNTTAIYFGNLTFFFVFGLPASNNKIFILEKQGTAMADLRVIFVFKIKSSYFFSF